MTGPGTDIASEVTVLARVTVVTCPTRNSVYAAGPAVTVSDRRAGGHWQHAQPARSRRLSRSTSLVTVHVATAAPDRPAVTHCTVTTAPALITGRPRLRLVSATECRRRPAAAAHWQPPPSHTGIDPPEPPRPRPRLRPVPPRPRRPERLSHSVALALRLSNAGSLRRAAAAGGPPVDAWLRTWPLQTAWARAPPQPPGLSPSQSQGPSEPTEALPAGAPSQAQQLPPGPEVDCRMALAVTVAHPHRDRDSHVTLEVKLKPELGPLRCTMPGDQPEHSSYHHLRKKLCKLYCCGQTSWLRHRH